MKRLLFPDYESLSQAAAYSMYSVVEKKPSSLLCLATGSSPEGLYRHFVELAKQDPSKSRSLRVIKLDEWGGLGENHPASCEHYLRNKFLDPLKVSSDRYISFSTNAHEHNAECRRIQAELDRLEPIDVCVLGLGTNGHLGLNEPAPYLTPHVHVAELAEQTKQHTMLQSNSDKPSYGYTLGMADLLRSKKIIMVVNGEKKKLQLQKLLLSRIDSTFPASFLWLHADVELYTDIDIA